LAIKAGAKGMSDIYEAMRFYVQKFPNDTVVLESKPDDPSTIRFQREVRNDWFAYLDRKGLKHTRSTWELILRGYGKALTLPCANPDEFDKEYARQYSPRNRYWDD
jgi:hypothetical protein